MVGKLALSVMQLESREVMNYGFVSAADPFAGITADQVASQPGVNYPGTQVEPMVVTDPNRKNHMVAAWQQDRWSNGGARGIVVGVSDDGGRHWSTVVLPGVSLASGGKYARVTDPWLAYAPNGDLYATALAWNPAGDPYHPYPFDVTASAMLVSKSADGGRTWGAPRTLIEEVSPGLNALPPSLAFNDKETVTVDPHDSRFVYVTWTRISLDVNFATSPPAPVFRGPTYFSRSTDGGLTFETARPIYDPGAFSQTIGNQIVVLPNGDLVNMFAQGSEGDKNGDIAVIRSKDHGKTWSGPIIIATGASIPVTDPETGIPIRSADTIPQIAVDPRSGALYVVAQGFQLKNGAAVPGIIFSQSTDGGAMWSAPVSINRTPPGAPEANRQAFDPSVRVNMEGVVAVTYYDTRNNTPAPGLLTDAWAVFADPSDRRNAPGGLANPANWGKEVRLTPSSFDLEKAPQSTNENGGYFLGDYQGLTTTGKRFLAFFSVPGPNGVGTSGVYSRMFKPGDRGDQDGRVRDRRSWAAPDWDDFRAPYVDGADLIGTRRHRRL